MADYAKFDAIVDSDDENDAPAPAEKRGGNDLYKFDGGKSSDDGDPLKDLLSLGKDASMAELMAKMKALPPSAKQHFLDKLGNPDMMKAAQDLAKNKNVPGDSLMKAAQDLAQPAAEPNFVTAPAEMSDNTLHLFVGKQVVLSGLKARPELNGKRGACLHFEQAKGRYAVRVDGIDTPMLLKLDNLDLA